MEREGGSILLAVVLLVLMGVVAVFGKQILRWVKDRWR